MTELEESVNISITIRHKSSIYKNILQKLSATKFSKRISLPTKNILKHTDFKTYPYNYALL